MAILQPDNDGNTMDSERSGTKGKLEVRNCRDICKLWGEPWKWAMIIAGVMCNVTYVRDIEVCVFGLKLIRNEVSKLVWRYEWLCTRLRRTGQIIEWPYALLPDHIPEGWARHVSYMQRKPGQRQGMLLIKASWCSSHPRGAHIHCKRGSMWAPR